MDGFQQAYRFEARREVKMDWKTTLSYGLKAVAAATMVAGALGVPFVSMVGSAASMGSKFLDDKVVKEDST